MKKLIVLFFLFLCVGVHSQEVSAITFSDIKFGNKQFGDAQWNATACMTTTTCSSSAQTVGQLRSGSSIFTPGSTLYLQFTYTNTDTTKPWTLKAYNSNGTVAATYGNFRIINAGQGYFMISDASSGAGHGSLWSTQVGMVSGSVTFTETLNPTQAQMDSLANSYYSPNPISVAGQTYTPPSPTISGGTITQSNAPSNQVITSGSTSTAGPTTDQQTRVSTWQNSSSSGNLITIEQVYGSNNTVSFTQDGTRNTIDFTLGGNGNVISGTQTGSNYLKEEVPGWGNNITTIQTNTVGTNYTETKIQGNGNTVNHTQTGNGNKILFSTVQGDINTLTTTQSGDGAHFLETKLTGNFNNVKVDQYGSTANKANIDVTNAGGPASVDLQQSGGKNFTIIQSCVNPAGCTTVVRQ